MASKVFDTRKGSHVWPQRTICEVHRQLYDCLVLGRMDLMLPLLEEAYILGIKMTKKLTEYKLGLPEWKDNDSSEVVRLRQLRVQLAETLDEVGSDL